MPLDTFPNLSALIGAQTLSDRLDLEAAKTDATRLIKQLWPRLNKVEQQHLTYLGRSVSAGRLPAKRYYETLNELIRFHAVSLKPYPKLRHYLSYLEVSAKMDRSAIWDELAAAQKAIRETLLTTDSQRALGRLMDRVELISDMIHTRLTPSRLRAYHKERPAFTVEELMADLRLVVPGAEPLTKPDLEVLLGALPTQERFYELAHARDTILAENTLKKLAERPVPVTALITGGFHTPGLARYFKDRNIAYAVILPAAKEEFDESLYKARLFGESPSIADLLQHLNQQALNPIQSTNSPGLAAQEVQTVRIQDRSLDLSKGAADYLRAIIAKGRLLEQKGRAHLDAFIAAVNQSILSRPALASLMQHGVQLTQIAAGLAIILQSDQTLLANLGTGGAVMGGVMFSSGSEAHPSPTQLTTFCSALVGQLEPFQRFGLSQNPDLAAFLNSGGSVLKPSYYDYWSAEGKPPLPPRSSAHDVFRAVVHSRAFRSNPDLVFYRERLIYSRSALQQRITQLNELIRNKATVNNVIAAIESRLPQPLDDEKRQSMTAAIGQILREEFPEDIESFLESAWPLSSEDRDDRWEVAWGFALGIPLPDALAWVLYSRSGWDWIEAGSHYENDMPQLRYMNLGHRTEPKYKIFTEEGLEWVEQLDALAAPVYEQFFQGWQIKQWKKRSTCSLRITRIHLPQALPETTSPVITGREMGVYIPV